MEEKMVGINVGGSWNFHPLSSRITMRDWNDPNRCFACLGFRLIRTAVPIERMIERD